MRAASNDATGSSSLRQVAGDFPRYCWIVWCARSRATHSAHLPRQHHSVLIRPRLDFPPVKAIRKVCSCLTSTTFLISASSALLPEAIIASIGKHIADIVSNMSLLMLPRTLQAARHLMKAGSCRKWLVLHWQCHLTYLFDNHSFRP